MNEVSAPGLGWFYKMVRTFLNAIRVFWHNFNVQLEAK